MLPRKIVTLKARLHPREVRAAAARIPQMIKMTSSWRSRQRMCASSIGSSTRNLKRKEKSLHFSASMTIAAIKQATWQKTWLKDWLLRWTNSLCHSSMLNKRMMHIARVRAWARAISSVRVRSAQTTNLHPSKTRKREGKKWQIRTPRGTPTVKDWRSQRQSEWQTPGGRRAWTWPKQMRRSGKAWIWGAHSARLQLAELVRQGAVWGRTSCQKNWVRDWVWVQTCVQLIDLAANSPSIRRLIAR